MNRLYSVLTVVAVVLIAMGFAAANAGNRVTLNLGLLILYRVPVTFVAFSGLFVGMLAMFAMGIHSDLKVRKILRDRLAEESRREQSWIDRSQQDLFDEPALKGVDETMEAPPEEVGEGPAEASAQEGAGGWKEVTNGNRTDGSAEG